MLMIFNDSILDPADAPTFSTPCSPRPSLISGAAHSLLYQLHQKGNAWTQTQMGPQQKSFVLAKLCNIKIGWQGEEKLWWHSQNPTDDKDDTAHGVQPP